MNTVLIIASATLIYMPLGIDKVRFFALKLISNPKEKGHQPVIEAIFSSPFTSAKPDCELLFLWCCN